MLIYHGVRPFLVFDGDYLPSKAQVEKHRKLSREKAFSVGKNYMENGLSKEAQAQFQKCVDITPEMVAVLAQVLRDEKIPFVVAPYEADAQLVYLENKGVISAIISEDSDLLVFGAQVLLTKMDDRGNCIQIRRERFPLCRDLALADLSDAQLRAMAIFSGCDYSPGIPNVGLKTAHRYLRKYSIQEALRVIRMESTYNVPTDFDETYRKADLTFQHQRVYSFQNETLVMLHDNPNIKEDFIGKDIPSDVCQKVAKALLHPTSKMPLNTAGMPLPTISLAVKVKPSLSMNSFFSPRTPNKLITHSERTHSFPSRSLSKSDSPVSLSSTLTPPPTIPLIRKRIRRFFDGSSDSDGSSPEKSTPSSKFFSASVAFDENKENRAPQNSMSPPNMPKMPKLTTNTNTLLPLYEKNNEQTVSVESDYKENENHQLVQQTVSKPPKLQSLSRFRFKDLSGSSLPR